MVQRQFLKVDGMRLAYLDFGGNGAPMLALHGTYSRGSTFTDLAEAVGENWRVVALDQRGHGWSDSPDDYSREAYINDAASTINTLKLAPAVVLGHSSGGVIAYLLAARHPELVRAIIIEDIGVVVESYSSIDWPERFSTVKTVRAFLAKNFSHENYFLESLVEYPDGWGFRFNLDVIKKARQSLNGNWWKDWLASNCPALLTHGNKSWAVTTEHVREMATRRSNTRLVEFPNCGHVIHDEDPVGFNKAVDEFLNSI